MLTNIIKISVEDGLMIADESDVARSAYNELFDKNPSNGPDLLPFVGFVKSFPDFPLYSTKK
ncbi:hypothetical protein Hanom_Chr15g01370511 [Helianthus anomalus]